MKARVNRAAVSGVLTLTGLAWVPLYAQVAFFNVPSEDAGKSIPELGRQAGVQIIAPGEMLHGLVTPAIKGSYDVHLALEMMLKGTGLVVDHEEDGVITISARDNGCGKEEAVNNVKRETMRTVSLLALLFGAATAPACQAQDTTSATDSVESIETVVVTAQKRSERLQEVPINVNVVDSEQLARQHISNTNDLALAVPSLTVAGGNVGGLQLRGIGTSTYARSAEASVSVVFDGIPLDRSQASQLYDLGHVEVLNGPQGMLFGKNSSAGVVSIVPRKPDFNEFKVTATAEYGERSFSNDTITVNLPLSDSLATRLSAHYGSFGHTVLNTYYDKWDFNSDIGVRGQLRWVPTDSLTVDLIADYERTNMNGVNTSVGVLRKVYPATGNSGGIPADLTGGALASYNATMATLAACGVTPSAENNRTCTDGVNKGAGGVGRPNEFLLFGVTVNWDIGDYTVTSISALRRNVYGDSTVAPGTPGNDADGTPSNWLSSNLNYGSASTYSQELRVASPVQDRISYVAGIYASTSTIRSTTIQSGNFAPVYAAYVCIAAPCSRAGQSTDVGQNYAIFGQATVRITDGLRFILGARETKDVLKESGITYTPAGLTPLPAASQFVPLNVKDSRDNFSWRTGLQYDVTPDMMAYVTVSRGYKGAFFAPQQNGSTIVEPEIPMAYEVGTKSTLLNGRFAVNLAFFYTRVKGFQTTVFMPASGTLPSGFFSSNAPYIITRGVDLSFFGSPIRNLYVNGGILYNNATYPSDFKVACSQLLSGGVGNCVLDTSGTYSYANHMTAFSPQWKMTLSGQYDVPLGGRLSGMTGYVQGDVTYTSSFNYSPTPDPNFLAPNFTRLGGRLGIRSDNGMWSLSVFGRNLLDQRIPAYVIPDPMSYANGLGLRSYNHGLNANSYRIVGVGLDLKY